MTAPQTQAPQEVLEKIRKIQTLADRAGTPEEAAAAVAKVQQFLFKYNLDLAAVMAAGSESLSRVYGKYVYKLPFGDSWRRELMYALAQFNFCRSLYIRSTPYVQLIGEEHNVELIKGLYPQIDHQIFSMANRAWKEEGHIYAASEGIGYAAWRNTYCRGAARTIYYRMEKEAQELRNSTEEASALVVAVDVELDEALARFFPERGTGPAQRRISSNSAYHMGREAGERVILHNRPQLKG